MTKLAVALSLSTMWAGGVGGALALLGGEASGMAIDFLTNSYAVMNAGAVTNGYATSYITFTRASGATRVNSLGLIETVGNDVARIDYDPVTLAAKGLLVEEQRTNLALRSNAFSTNLPWQVQNAPTIIQNDTGPDGVASTAWTITDSDAVNTASVFQAFTVANDTAFYTSSLFIKKTASATSFPALVMNILGGTTGILTTFALNTNTGVATASASNNGSATATVTDNGNFWRFQIRNANNATGNTTLYYQFCPAYNSTGNGTGTGATTGSSVVYGAQLEAGAFATSYIPTTSASVTRSADVASVATSAFPYNASEGTLVANGTNISISSASSKGLVSLNAGSSANSISIWTNASNAISQMDNTTTQAFWSVATTEPIRAAVAYKANDTNFSIAGVAQTTDTVCTVPTVTLMQIGGLFSGSNFQLNGWIRQITYIPRRLSNAELQSRTA